MYHAFIHRKVRWIFENLEKGNFDLLLKDFNPEFEHTFPGAHALGGVRRNVPAMRLWFQRLAVLFPHLKFEIKNILVRGGPWNTTIAVEWIDRAILPDGQPYENRGMHFMRLRWGRLVELHAYLDSQNVVIVLERLARIGIKEASAPAIE